MAALLHLHYRLLSHRDGRDIGRIGHAAFRLRIAVDHHFKRLIRHHCRLNQRQLQAAKYGIGADPSISIEIEDLTKEIAKQERELKALGG